MPTARRDGRGLYYEADGEGEVVAFVADAGYGAWSWGWQHRVVAGPFDALVWDLPGTGRSDPSEGASSVAALAADLEAVLADHGARRVHLVGHGLGGMVALRSARDSGRVVSLTLIGTSPGGPLAPLPPDARTRAYAPPDDPEGLRRATAAALTDAFVADQPAVVDGIVDWRADEDAGPAAWRAQDAAVEAFDASDWLHEVTEPALVVHGRDDAQYPVENGRLLAEGLPRGDLLELDGGHLVTVERSRPLNDELVAFLERHRRDE